MLKSIKCDWLKSEHVTLVCDIDQSVCFNSSEGLSDTGIHKKSQTQSQTQK